MTPELTAAIGQPEAVAVRTAWDKYQKAYDRCQGFGLKFGETCKALRDKYAAQGSSNTVTWEQVREALGIKKTSAAKWIGLYERSLLTEEQRKTHDAIVAQANKIKRESKQAISALTGTPAVQVDTLTAKMIEFFSKLTEEHKDAAIEFCSHLLHQQKQAESNPAVAAALASTAYVATV